MEYIRTSEDDRQLKSDYSHLQLIWLTVSYFRPFQIIVMHYGATKQKHMQRKNLFYLAYLPSNAIIICLPDSTDGCDIGPHEVVLS